MSKKNQNSTFHPNLWDTLNDLRRDVYKNDWTWPDKIVYEPIKGKNGRVWYVAVNVPNRAELVLVDDPHDHSGACGGLTLIDGSHSRAGGLWYSNARSLHEDTGVSLKGETYSMGFVIDPETLEVVHKDKEKVLGNYERIDEIALELAKKNQKAYYRFSRTYDGASLGLIDPSYVIS